MWLYVWALACFLISFVIWGGKKKQHNFCEFRFCPLRNGKGSTWLSGSCHLHHSLGLMNGSEMGWERLLKQETTLWKCELFIIIPNTTAPFLQQQPRAACWPDNSGPDVANICLLLPWAFYRERGNKGAKKACILDTHGQVFLTPPAASPPLRIPWGGEDVSHSFHCSKCPARCWL